MKTAFDKSWTLFLDRDGVINKKPPNDYVKKWSEFHFIQGVLIALPKLSEIFNKIIVVTNQQGVGKGLYTPDDLNTIHSNMLDQIQDAKGRINHIYYCTNLASENSLCRKPNTGMAIQAKADYPEIDFNKSVIVGDSVSDMEFGKKLEMYLVYIAENNSALPENLNVDRRVKTLLDWAETL
ncbi:MAG: HAD-IIIA family hydrolase [Bacteroidota bacterium]|nr:HAD-IIIA family hydrolase [Bacteroidota bacterium]